MTLYSQKDSNIHKTWLLFGVFLIIIIGIGWIFFRIYNSADILYFAVIFSVLMNIIAYWHSDKIVLKMAQARPIEKKDNPELYNIVENLAITAGLPLPKIYVINESAPNAFATGRNPEHGVVAVTTGLFQKLNKTELEGVIAHELSHIGNRDILLSTAVVILVGFISILSDMFLRSSFFGGRKNREGGQAQAFLMLMGIILAILAPIAAVLMQLAISRKREFLADASGALLTRYPEGLASALEKIASDPTPLSAARNTTAHLWFDDPFTHGIGDGKKVHWLHRLFMTHPPVEERITALRGRENLRELKIKKADIHLENIDPNDLTREDLIIFDKFFKNDLTEEEFNLYRNNLKDYFRLQRQIKKEQYNALKDSRSNFSAMIANKIMSKKAEKMLMERKFKKAA